MPAFARSTRTPLVQRLVVIGLTAAIMAGCHSDKTNTAPLTATAIVTSVGGGQAGTVGQPLAQSISVLVTDQDGNPVSGATVSWSPSAHGGTVSSATSSTDASGMASVTWTLGTLVGIDSLSATIPGGAASTITATATAAPFSTLVKVSGDLQSITAGTTSQPFVVEATDQFGNVVAGTTVTWTATGTGTLSAATGTTDVNGLSQVTLATSPTAASYTITATAGTAAPVIFTLTAN